MENLIVVLSFDKKEEAPLPSPEPQPEPQPEPVEPPAEEPPKEEPAPSEPPPVEEPIPEPIPEPAPEPMPEPVPEPVPPAEEPAPEPPPKEDPIAPEPMPEPAPEEPKPEEPPIGSIPRDGAILRALEDYQEMKLKLAQSKEPRPNSLACPNCGKELMDVRPHIVDVEHSNKEDDLYFYSTTEIGCECGFKGERII